MSKSAKRTKTRKQRRQTVAAPDLKQIWLWCALIASVIGLGIAFYATSNTYSVAQNGISANSGCNINEWISCDPAHASVYAKLMGVPVAWWGFLYYLFVAVSAGFAKWTSNKDHAAGATAAAFLFSVFAVLFSLYKAWNLMALSVLCIVCLGMYLLNIANLVFLFLALNLSFKKIGAFMTDYLKSLFKRPSNLNFAPRPLFFGLIALVIFGGGFAGIKQYQDNNGLFQEQDLDVDRALRLHFRQQTQDVAVDPEAGLWGNPEADIVIVEFSDFQCPSCKAAAFHMRGLLFEFKDDVQFRYMNFPLDRSINQHIQNNIHQFAGMAATASVCAAQRGDFWEYHDDIFRNQERLNPVILNELAQQRGWDLGEFNACMTDEATIARVKRDIETAMTLNVNETPTIFINGRRVRAWGSTELVRAIIQEEIKRANQG